MLNIDELLVNADWPKRTDDRMAALRTAEFDESKHERDSIGRFAPHGESAVGGFQSGRADDMWAWNVNEYRTEVPSSRHQVVRPDRGAWGYSHGNSKAFTGKSAEMMGIEGYKQIPGVEEKVPNAFLEAIADSEGSEEPLYHSFENVRGIKFNEGDTFRLPLTATAGSVGSYGIRSDRDDQRGEPVVFKFEQGTQMAGYSTLTPRSAREAGYKTVEEGLREQKYLWDEAIVAGGFKVVEVRGRVALGLQHWGSKKDHGTAFGRVVTLRQTEMFDPREKRWKPRG